MRGGQETKRGRWARGIVAILTVAIVSAVAAEFVARALFDLAPLRQYRPYQPIFVSGDYHYPLHDAELRFVAGGAIAMGYRASGFGLDYDPSTRPTRTATSFSDYLFAHNLSRYSAAEIDRIACDEPHAMFVYVIGGSVAQGFSATSKEDSWHARLERQLRDRLQRRDIYVFNGAMGAFVSLQEKLAYYLAVVPRPSHLVLVVNGYNDVFVPSGYAVRPGDPYQLGLRFSQFFGNGFIWWLARQSAIANTVVTDQINQHIGDARRKLERDDVLFAQHSEAIADIYVENMTELLDVCAARGQACLVAIQPARSVTAHYLGALFDDVLSQKRMVQLYRRLLEKVAAGRRSDKFIDLTHVFDDGEGLRYYTDPVHSNSAGQQALANALMIPVLTALKSAKPVAESSDRCDRLR